MNGIYNKGLYRKRAKLGVRLGKRKVYVSLGKLFPGILLGLSQLVILSPFHELEVMWYALTGNLLGWTLQGVVPDTTIQEMSQTLNAVRSV